MISPRDQAESRVINSKVISKSSKLTLVTNIGNRSPLNRQLNKQSAASNHPSYKKNSYQNQQQILNKLESNSSPRYSTTSIEVQNDIGKTISKKGNNNELGLISDKKENNLTPLQQQKSNQSRNYQGYSRPQQNGKKVALVHQNIINKSVNLQNGDRYEGQFRSSLYHGNGVYIFKAQNCKYQGEFQSGKQHGFGILTNLTTQQRVYEGEWQQGMKHGEGRYTYDSDQYYNGNWINDQKHGAGVYHFKGGFYNGFWFKNKREGKDSSLKLQNGTEYKGVFSGNQFVKGFVRYPNGDEYSGQMKNNRRSGEGSYIDASTKTRYKGVWHNDKKNGRGTLTYGNGDQLTGVFTDGLLNEREVVMYKWRDGSIFNGWFADNQPNKGTVSRPTGEKWQI